MFIRRLKIRSRLLQRFFAFRNIATLPFESYDYQYRLKKAKIQVKI